MDAGFSSVGKQRICVALSMGSYCYAVHIVDIASEDGTDSLEMVDLSRVDTYRFGRQFVERDPNFLVLNFYEVDAVCGLGSTMLMFEGVDYRQLRFTQSDSKGIYSIPLSAEHTVRTPPQEQRPCYYKTPTSDLLALKCATQLHKTSDMLGLKCAPEAVPVPIEYGTSSSTSIIIFSTEIEYYFNDINSSDARVVDFEIYNTESKLSVKLPPLHIARQSATIFMLVDLVRDQSFSFTPKYNIEEYHSGGGAWRSSFGIRAYTFFDDHTFVVEPDFGGVRFSLDIASENQKWELFGVHISFPCPYQHFITKNMLVLSSHRAHKVGYEYEASAIFRFPLCSFVFPQLDSKNTSIILLGHTRSREFVACIVQIGKDDSERPFWTIDVARVCSWKFTDSIEDRNEDGQFARRIKSFKFAFNCNFVTSGIVGLFAF